jgi:tape measure domain-containing protein
MASKDIEAGRAHVIIRLRDQVTAGLKHVERSVAGFGKSFTSVASGIAGTGAAAAAGFAGVLGALAFPTKLAADMEVLRAGFLTLTKSADATDKLLEQIKQAAAATPFEIPELAATAKTLMAFGSSSDVVVDEMMRIGDVASAINAPIGEIAEIYGKARVQGRLFASDINQLTGRGIPLIQELAKQFGTTEESVKDLVESGQVNFSHLEKAFVSLTTGAGLFAGGMARASQTVIGKWSTLKDTIAGTIRPIGDALLPVVSSLLSAFNDLLQPVGRLIEQYKGVAVVVAGVATAGALASAALATVGTVGVGAAAALTFAASTVTAAWSLAASVIGIAMSPIVAPVLAIVAAVAVYSAAIGALTVYIASEAGIIAQAYTWLSTRAFEMSASVQKAFGGIIAAMQSGQYALAARILWAGLKVVFFQGAQALLEAFNYLWTNAWNISNRFFATLLTRAWRVFTSLPELMRAAITGHMSLGEILADALSGDLDLGNVLGDQVGSAKRELQSLLAQVKRTPTNSQANGQQPPPQQMLPSTTSVPGSDAVQSDASLSDQVRQLREKRQAHEMRSYTSSAAFDKAEAALRNEELIVMRKVQAQKRAEFIAAKEQSERFNEQPPPELEAMQTQVKLGNQIASSVTSSGTFSAAGAAASLGFNARPLEDTARNTKRMVTLLERDRGGEPKFA